MKSASKLFTFSVSLISLIASYAYAGDVLQTLNCTAFKRFGFVSGMKFYFNVKESTTAPFDVSIASLLIPGSGPAKNVVIELVDQDTAKAYFAYNDVDVTYDKVAKVASFTKPLANGLNDVYAYCSK